MEKIRELRDEISPETILIGNGDVLDLEEADEKIHKNKIDGVMIGRGIFQNPFLFNRQNIDDFPVEKRLGILLRHMHLFEFEFGETKENIKKFGKRIKAFHLMKKFFKIYVNGFDGAKELRIKLMEAKNKDEVKKIVYDFLKQKN